jgi:phospholipase A1/A2
MVGGLCVWAAPESIAVAQDVRMLVAGPAQPVRSGERIVVRVHHLNESAAAVRWEVPVTAEGRLQAGERTFEVRLDLGAREAAGVVVVEPGRFAARDYELRVPDSIAGRVWLSFAEWQVAPVVIEVSAAGFGDTPGGTPAASAGPGFSRLLREGESGAGDAAGSGAMQFFKEHFFGYEPFYFLAGAESPNAKFQVSLRYRILNHEGALARKVPWLEGLNLAYTQTSLWDLGAPSAPFFDSSYKPELLYLWERVDGGRWADWVRLDLQGGLQHESNGKGGADSRSLNIAYVRPTLTLGGAEGFQASVSTRAWVYVGDLDDNPDLKDYRGYVDLRATVGWARGLQLAAMGRMGDDWEHGSLQLDLTYPMMAMLSRSFSLYLQVQYFTGYGESLLLYNQRSDAVRAGFALYR